MKPVSELTDLTRKTAVVTGGAAGIGLGVVRRLVEAGANVVIADIDETAAATAARLRAGWHGRAGSPRAAPADPAHLIGDPASATASTT